MLNTPIRTGLPSIRRRQLIQGGAAALAAAGALHADVPAHRWDGYNFGPGPAVPDRLNQGPFDIDQDEGWRTQLFTTPTAKPVRNPGLGLVGYTWEESGPATAVRAGKQTLEQSIRAMAALPFVDVLYIRCDWRHVQAARGKLALHPVWEQTFAAAKAHELRVAFRVQLSNPEPQPKVLAMPDFLQQEIPFVEIGSLTRPAKVRYREPRYDHPAFLKAFTELNELLAERFDGDPSVEWVDLMQYGFWGEGHTSNLPSPFADYVTAERTSLQMTQVQLDRWKRTPLAVNTQPDISRVGNREVIDRAVRAGAWLRSDSVIIEEPMQIEMISNRPPWLAAVLEDGYFRHYDVTKLETDGAGVNVLENYMLHVADLRGNYWSLWTEAEHLQNYQAKYPRGFRELQAKLGYRLRPAWVWQRKRHGGMELIAGIANQGVAGVPGVLRLTLADQAGKWQMTGALDAGQPFGGSVRQASFQLPSGFFGSVRLRADLEIRPGVRRKVQWACEQAAEPDGSMRIEIVRPDAPGWRKGV